MSPSTSPVKGYRAVVIVIVVSCCVGVGMFVMLAIIVAIKRGNACSEHGPCANCCGEQQGTCMYFILLRWHVISFNFYFVPPPFLRRLLLRGH